MHGFDNRNVAAILKSIQQGVQGPTGVVFSYAGNIPASFITPSGYELLKPVGYIYQLLDCSLQTIGGNAAGANISIVFTQPITGNQITLVTFAPAGLLQNTITRMGDPNTTVSTQSINTAKPMTNVRIIESGGGVTGASSFYLRMTYFLFR